MARTLTDGERDILTEQNRDAADDAQAEWDALTDEEREAAMEAGQREYARLEADEARARECARLDIACWQTQAQREAAAFEAFGDAEYEAWLDARDAMAFRVAPVTLAHSCLNWWALERRTDAGWETVRTYTHESEARSALSDSTWADEREVA